MYRNPLGFSAPWRLLFALFMCSAIFTVTARPKPWQQQEEAHKRASSVNNNDIDPLQSKQVEKLEFTGQLSSNTRTKQPFHRLAPDVEYFEFDPVLDESEESLAVGTGEQEQLTKVCNDTKHSPRSPYRIFEDARRCQCATVEGAPITSTTMATTTATAEPPLDEIQVLERAIYKMCSRLRKKVEIRARDLGSHLTNLRDDCSVTFYYGFNATMWGQSDHKRTLSPHTAYVSALDTNFASFSPRAGNRQWTPTEESYWNQKWSKPNGQRLMTELEKFERNLNRRLKIETTD